MRKCAHLSAVFAAVALLAVPAVAQQAQPTGGIIEDLDCILTVDNSSDFYEGCAVAVVSDGNMTGVGFALDPQRSTSSGSSAPSIIFAGVRQTPKLIKVVGVSINDGQPMPAPGTCTAQPNVITCSANLAGRTVKVEARGQAAS